MEVHFLTSLMGTITVVAMYYWVARSESPPITKAAWPMTSSSLRVSPPFWSNEWI
jgi:hypothetical protein